MKVWSSIRTRLAFVFRRSCVEREMEEELRAHLQNRADDLGRQGLSRPEAERQAGIEFGGYQRYKEECREGLGTRLLGELVADVRYGLRQLRRNPGFTAVAILTLALGIGANTAIFSVVNAVLLRPLPFPHSGRLVRIWEDYGSRQNHSVVSYPNFADWRTWSRSFSGIAAYHSGVEYTLTGQGEPMHLQGITASANLFDILGVQPILGRRFFPAEDRPHADEGADAIIISYKGWKDVFHGNPKIIGQGLTLDGKPFVVVGVAPPGLESLIGYPKGEFWTTAAPLAERSPQSPKPLSEERSMSFLGALARLKQGVALAQAQADMDHVAGELMRAYPTDDPKEGVLLEGLQESMTGKVRPLLMVLLAAVGVVLLIACANVAALVLGRATGRQREINIRAALGAGRLRIARQLLVESLLLAVIGGMLGLFLAIMIGRSLIKFLGVTWLTEVPLDARVLGFVLLAGVGSALLFGLAPALHAARTDLAAGLRECGQATGETRRLRRFRKILVTGQVALAVALLCAAGLLTRSLINLEQTDSGFNAEHVLAFPISLPQQQYPQASWAPFFQQLVTRLRELPGVVSASAGSSLPLQGGEDRTAVDNVAGQPIPPESKLRGIVFSPVTPGYFQTLGIPLKVGREFTDQDTPTSQPVVIINEAAARRYFGNHNPVGQLIEPMMWDGSGSKTEMRTIIGVVGDVKFYNLTQAADPSIYWPLTQIPSDSSMYIEIRTASDPLSVVSLIRERLHDVDKKVPLYDVRTLDSYLDKTLVQPRYNVLLVASFAVLALLLTAVGLYGSISYSVAQRTHEIGIRMALGAQQASVFRAVLMDGMVVAGVGTAIGLGAATAATRLIRSLLFGVSPGDPLTYSIDTVILMGVALAACYIPARRAAEVDPMVALRHE